MWSRRPRNQVVPPQPPMLASTSTLLLGAATAATPPPFSFSFGGVYFHSEAPAASWEATTASFATTGDKSRSYTDFTWTSPNGLQVQAKQTTYETVGTAGATEWVLSFRNVGSVPSPQLCNISALDTVDPVTPQSRQGKTSFPLPRHA